MTGTRPTQQQIFADAIRTHGGTWDTRRAAGLLGSHGYTYADPGAARRRARELLRRLARDGVLIRQPGRAAVYHARGRVTTRNTGAPMSGRTVITRRLLPEEIADVRRIFTTSGPPTPEQIATLRTILALSGPSEGTRPTIAAPMPLAAAGVPS